MGLMRERSALALTCFSALILSATTARSAEIAWHVTGQVGGPTSAVAVTSNHAFVGVGFRVLIYDSSTPDAPTEVGSTAAFADLVTAVSISGNRAFVTAGSAGLRIVDVSDVAHPAEIGSWDSPGYAEAVAVVGDRAFVADGPYGLQILDVSEPRSPRPLSSCFDMNYAYDVAVQEGRAYIAAAGAGLLVADLGDPAHPIELAALDTPGFARRVAVTGGIAYVADEWGGVRIVSIAEPAHPAEISSVTLPSWAFGVALSGTTLFVADGSQGLRALDVAAPASPREVGTYPITWQHADAVTVADGRAYVSVRGEGFHIVDVRDRAAPRRLAVETQLAEARAAVAAGDIAYVAAADQGLRVIDLAAGAREVGTVAAGGYAYCIATMGTGTLIVGSTGIGTPGVHFFDLADPRRPRPLSVLAGVGINPTDISVEGSLVAISGEPGIHLIDASDPAAPKVLSFLNVTAGSPLADLVWDVALAGRTALVAQSGAGLRLVDITDPRAPKIVGTYKPETLVQAQAVAASGRYAYVLGGPSGLHVVDISDPRAPATVAVLRPLVGGERMRLVGSTLLVAAGAGGLVTVDVADPARPVITGNNRLPGYAFGASGTGERILVSSGEAGFFVLRRDGAGASHDPVFRPVIASPPAGPPGLLEALGETATQGARRAVDEALASFAEARRKTSPGVAAARALVVRSAADAGPGTLREVLAGLEAGDTVTFDPAIFPPGAPTTIRITGQLPCLCKDGVTIDASNAGVVIDGSGAPPDSIGLILPSNENRVMGLAIVGFDDSGIWLSGSRNVIGGDRSRGAGPSGQGNVLSGNKQAGIKFPDWAASGNRVVGNLIGTDATGTRPLGRQYIGVFLFPGGPGNIIGGTEPWEANVISGNAVAEVFFQQARGDTVAGNLIGTDPTGTKRVGSAGMGLGTGAHSSDHMITGNVIVGSGQGIIISDSGSFYNQIVGNRIGVGLDGVPLAPVDQGATNGVSVSQSYNRIADNLISGNTQWGITFDFWASHDSVVTGNLIGTDPSGKEARANGRSSWGGGIYLSTLTHGFVGGTTAAERNVISGNAGSGIVLSGPGPKGNFILGDFVGLDAAGQLPLGNGKSGVDLNASDGNFVQGNVLAWNGWNGIVTADSSGNRFRRNWIHHNVGRGIEIGQGSDQLPPAPEISSVTGAAVHGRACPGCVVEVFSDAAGQGQFYEGMTFAAADGTFFFQKAANTSGRLMGRPYVTATATDPVRGTSSFSAPVRAPRHAEVPARPEEPLLPRPPEG
jgi:parallel beta-helix repeat protein